MTKQRLLASTFVAALALAPAAQAQIFGPSDEDRAHEAAQDSGIRDLGAQGQAQDARLRTLEDKVRTLTDSLARSTGANEELNHQIQVQNDKIDRMQKDFAYRLCTLSAQQMGAADAMNCAAAGTPSAGAAFAPSPGALRPGDQLPPIDATGNGQYTNGQGGFVTAPDPGPVRGRAPGSLGTLPMGSGPGPAVAAPAGNVAQYDQAMNLMSRAQYEEAQAAFRAYADANPADGDLSPQAIYWVGNISYVRQDYAPAARSFAEVIKKYPKSGRAPDAMLKLAQSFMGMGQKRKAAPRLALSKPNIRTRAPKRSTRPPASAKPPAASRLPASGAEGQRLEARFAAHMAGHDGPLAVAVSGGGDSLALMHLLAAFARAEKREPPLVLTVDHGLRPGSAKDAKRVATWAKQAGLKTTILSWRGPKPKSGIEAGARLARYRLMGAWLAKKKIGTLFVGHTEDDQAETFLLRLARGSGLDGLAAMQARASWPVEGFERLAVARPLLSFGRQDLRDYLTALGQPWLDDPMNEDPGFDRVKIRQARAALAEAGLSSARIAAAASHLARAREALEVVTAAVLARAVRQTEEGILLESRALAAAPREVGLRALAAVLMAVGGQAYRPRFESLERLYDRIAQGGFQGGATLHGCQVSPAPKNFAPHDLWVRTERPRKTGSSRRGTK